MSAGEREKWGAQPEDTILDALACVWTPGEVARVKTTNVLVRIVSHHKGGEYLIEYLDDMLKAGWAGENIVYHGRDLVPVEQEDGPTT